MWFLLLLFVVLLFSIYQLFSIFSSISLDPNKLKPIVITDEVKEALKNCKPYIPISPICVTSVSVSDKISGGNGSGVWLDTPYGDNLFLTNAHVVINLTSNKKNAPIVFITDAEGTIVFVEVIAIVNKSKGLFFKTSLADVAILRALTPLPKNFAATKHKLANNADIDHVFFKGYTGLPYIDGIFPIEKQLFLHKGKKALYLSKGKQIAYGGQSGSALLNKQGEIVGLITLTSTPPNGSPSYIFQYGNNDIVRLQLQEVSDIKGLPYYGVATPYFEIKELLDKTFGS